MQVFVFAAAFAPGVHTCPAPFQQPGRLEDLQAQNRDLELAGDLGGPSRVLDDPVALRHAHVHRMQF
jgi:hypothetical protein